MIRYKNFEMPDDFGIDIPFEDLLAYEISNNWICSYIPFEWVQDIMAKRMVKKVQRKYANYVRLNKMLEKVNSNYINLK